MSALPESKLCIVDVCSISFGWTRSTHDSCGRYLMFSLAERHCVEIDGKPVPISALALVVFRHPRPLWA